MGRSNLVARAFEGASAAAFWVAAAFLLFTVASVTTDVTLRYFFNRPITWLNETIETLMLYVTFLGGAWVARERGHVTVDILLARASARNQDRLRVISSLIACSVCAVLVVFGARVTWDFYVRGVHSMTVLELPVAAKLVVIPAGALLMLSQFLRELAGHWRELRGPRPLFTSEPDSGAET
ncbi:MAG: TRAP transporter small permease [Deferrisomatales bacterium]|nr:TRAP transporter small permease [Deferrisomatales bacterium]